MPKAEDAVAGRVRIPRSPAPKAGVHRAFLPVHGGALEPPCRRVMQHHTRRPRQPHGDRAGELVAECAPDHVQRSKPDDRVQLLSPSEPDEVLCDGLQRVHAESAVDEERVSLHRGQVNHVPLVRPEVRRVQQAWIFALDEFLLLGEPLEAARQPQPVEHVCHLVFVRVAAVEALQRRRAVAGARGENVVVAMAVELEVPAHWRPRGRVVVWDRGTRHAFRVRCDRRTRSNGAGRRGCGARRPPPVCHGGRCCLRRRRDAHNDKLGARPVLHVDLLARDLVASLSEPEEQSRHLAGPLAEQSAHGHVRHALAAERATASAERAVARSRAAGMQLKCQLQRQPSGGGGVALGPRQQ